jgi:cation:H+ antiporter
MLYIYISIFLISCFVLVFSGGKAIKALIRIAQFLELREFVVAFILMAFATSVPELLVGITSALHGAPELSFGDIMGSNIVNLTLAVAISVLIAGSLSARTSATRKDSLYTAIIVSLPILLIADGALSRIDGLVVLLALVFYMQGIFRQKQRFTKVFNDALERGWTQIKIFFKDIGFFLLSLLFLVASAEGVVWSASSLAEMLGLSLMMIGVLIVALGTNLPEIVFGVRSVTMGHKDMVLGNLMGSVVANSTLVLGTVVLISPFQIQNFASYLTPIIFTIGIAIFFAVFVQTKEKISRIEGVFLLLVYVLFVMWQLILS